VDTLRAEKERVLQEFRDRGELPDAVVNAAVVAEVLNDMPYLVPLAADSR
jgi:hypothetical protein